MNGVKTALLLGLLSGLLLFGGQMIAGRSGLEIALLIAVVMNFASYFFSDKIALASYSAQPVTPEENPEVYRRVFPLVQNLVQRMNLPMPKLWLIPDASPNAFATGRNPSHASVAFTAGILQIMNDRELEGVIAHELGHVLHRDIRDRVHRFSAGPARVHGRGAYARARRTKSCRSRWPVLHRGRRVSPPCARDGRSSAKPDADTRARPTV